MTAPYWASGDGDVTLYLGDCLDVLRDLPADSIDAIVTDPPAGVAFMSRTWDTYGSRARFVEWLTERLSEALRVLKPGGHALVWSLPRTSHWTAWAVEDAGFEVRDCVLHLFGSGFPKSLDVSKAIDKAAGAEREVIGPNRWQGRNPVADHSRQGLTFADDAYVRPVDPPLTAPATEDAARWEGWGTALKPGQEMWWLARKPLDGTVAGNVLEYGTGALNVDGCRVSAGARPLREADRRQMDGSAVYDGGSGRSGPFTGSQAAGTTTDGRWPANIVLTHSAACEVTGTRRVRNSVCGPQSTPGATGGIYGEWDEEATASRRGYGTEIVEAWVCAADCPVGELDRQSGSAPPSWRKGCGAAEYDRVAYGKMNGARGEFGYADSGGASRFYPTFRYQAKAPASERPRLDDGTAHETVKPLGFISWAVRLVTPPGGTVLDMFAGSGPVAEACIIEGFRAILIERDPKSAELIRIRLRKPIQPILA